MDTIGSNEALDAITDRGDSPREPRTVASRTCCNQSQGLLRYILLPFAALLAACSPYAESGLTKQEIQDITSLVVKQTTNHVVGLQRESSGDVTVLTAPLAEAAKRVGTTFIVRNQQGRWAVVSQKEERLDE